MYYATDKSDVYSVVKGSKFNFSFTAGTNGDVVNGINRPLFNVNEVKIPLPKGISLTSETDDIYMDYSDSNNPKLVMNNQVGLTNKKVKAYTVQLQADPSLDLGEHQSSLITNANILYAGKEEVNLERQAPIFNIIEPKVIEPDMKANADQIGNERVLLSTLIFANNQAFDLHNVDFIVDIPEPMHVYAINFGKSGYSITDDATITYTTNNGNENSIQVSGSDQFVSKNMLGLKQDEWLNTLTISYKKVKDNEMFDHNNSSLNYGIRLFGDVGKFYKDGSEVQVGDTANWNLKVTCDELDDAVNKKAIVAKLQEPTMTAVSSLGDIVPNNATFAPGTEVTFNLYSMIKFSVGAKYPLVYKNPVFYFKVPNIMLSNLTVDDFVVTGKGGVVLNPEISELKNKNGETFFKIEFSGEKGSTHSFYQSYFDLDNELLGDTTGLTIKVSTAKSNKILISPLLKKGVYKLLSDYNLFTTSKINADNQELIVNADKQELVFTDDNTFSEKSDVQLVRATEKTGNNKINAINIVNGKAFAGVVATKSEIDDNFVIASTEGITNNTTSKYRYTTNTKGSYLINLNNNYGDIVTDYVSYIKMPKINEGSGFNLCVDPANISIENNSYFKGTIQFEYSSDIGDDVKTFNYSKKAPSNSCSITSIKISTPEIVDQADIDITLPLSIDYSDIKSINDLSYIKMIYDAKVNGIDNIAQYESKYQLYSNQLSGNISEDINYENKKTNNVYEQPIKLDLLDSNNKVVSTTYSDEVGNYNFILPILKTRSYQNYQIKVTLPDGYMFAPQGASVIDPQTAKSEVLDLADDQNDIDVIIAKKVQYDINAVKDIIDVNEQSSFNVNISNGQLGSISYDKDYLNIKQDPKDPLNIKYTGLKSGSTNVTFEIKDGYGRDVASVVVKITITLSTPEIPELIEPEKSKIIKDKDGNLALDYDFDCGVVYTPDMFKIKATEGIKYTTSIKDNNLIIKAVAEKGYVLTGNTSWSIKLPEVVPCIVEITEIPAPSLNEVACNQVPSVQTDKVSGIEWQVTHNETDFNYVIKAVAQEGYSIKTDIQTNWTLDYTIEVCPTDINKPGIIDPEKPGVELPTEENNGVIIVKPEANVTCGKQAEIIFPEITGLVFSKEELANNQVKVSVSAAKGYTLPNGLQTEWIFELPEVVPCIVEITEIPAPSLNEVACNQVPSVQTDKVSGIEWQVTHNETDFNYEIKAIAQEGYSIKTDIQTDWTLDYTIEVCSTDINKPGIIDPEKPGVELPTEENNGIIIVKPEANIACGKQAEIILPEITGLVFSKEELTNNQVKVSVSAAKGYTLPNGIQTEWIFELPEVIKCLPEIQVPGGIIDPNNPDVEIHFEQDQDGIFIINPDFELACGVEDFIAQTILESMTNKITGVEYNVEYENNILTITISAQEGYELAKNQQTVFKYQIPDTQICEVESFEIKYNLHHGINHKANPLVYIPGNDRLDLKEPKHDEDKFLGWFMEYTKTRSGKLVDINTAFNKDTTGVISVHAVWQISSEKPIIEFDCDNKAKVISYSDEFDYLITYNKNKTITVKSVLKDESAHVIKDGDTTEWTYDIKTPSNCETDNNTDVVTTLPTTGNNSIVIGLISLIVGSGLLVFRRRQL